MIPQTDQKFAEEFLEKVTKKLTFMAAEIGANFPNTFKGIWDPKGVNADVSDWTTAFWPGMMWLMYIKTGNEMFAECAKGCEDKLDRALDLFEGVHHDAGFMWSLSAVADYKLTGNDRSRVRALHAASTLVGRFNLAGRYIRAWNIEHNGKSIIDSMMNIPILTWASKVTDDPRFHQIATAHADTVMKNFVRPDGSVHHMVDFDANTGEPIGYPGGQGYGEGSAWTRGQAWAIYGFAQAYLNIGKIEYLETAKRVAHYFIANLEPDEIPVVDFRAPKEPKIYDASAGSIAACGLIEIAKAVPEGEARLYEEAAMSLLRGLDKNCCYDEAELVLLKNSTSSYHSTLAVHKPFIFGDYYLVEALMKLHGNDGRFTIHN